MSKETSKWLNTNTLIGHTDKRGKAWHYKESDQGAEPNHYAGAIPLADVYRRLFSWHVIERPIMVDLGGFDFQPIAGKKAMVADDDNTVLGIFTDGYQGHQYDEWLAQSVETIIGGGIDISSAGLLANRAVAWVEVGVPENMTTPEGVEFRPNLVACTSFDGSLSTTYKRTVTNTVCDNTLRASLCEDGQQLKIKHSRYSHLKLNDARDALAIVQTTAEDFTAQVKTLCEWNVSPTQWSRLVDQLVPLNPDGSKRSVTMAGDKRDKLKALYVHDERVAPWAGNAFGVLQAFNTYAQHIQIVRNAHRVERNQLDVLKGNSAKADALVISTLAEITGRQLVNA